MAQYLNRGERAVRPGTYYHIGKKGENIPAGASDGVVAVLFKSNWGPLNEIVEVSAEQGYKDRFGNEGTTDAIALAIEGGAKKLVLVRVGDDDGTAAAVTLKDDQSSDAIDITAKYVGSRSFAISVRDSIADSSSRECIIYSGTTEFEKLTFAKGGDEVAALVAAFSGSKNFTAAKKTGATGILATATQKAFTAGSDPTTSTTEYSAGMDIAGTVRQNCICLDTGDYAIISLLAAYVKRSLQEGNNVIACVGEPNTVALATREQHAAACNDAGIVYVLNGKLGHSVYGEIDGYQTAAKVCGMIAGTSCKYSLTHTVMSNITDLKERLTNAQIIEAEKSGCLVFTTNASRQIWIDYAITTLVTLTGDQDEGWKKIRRTKTRYEVLQRANDVTDSMIGKVDNDTPGRIAIMDAIGNVGNAMIGEGKLTSLAVVEDPSYSPEGDSAFFLIDIVDKDSAEHIYLGYTFRFETTEE